MLEIVYMVENCFVFNLKDTVLSGVRTVFNFDKVHYTFAAFQDTLDIFRENKLSSYFGQFFLFHKNSGLITIKEFQIIFMYT